MEKFYYLFSIILLQRLIELIVAKRNERWMKAKGAVEFGQNQYRWIVVMHLLFFVSIFSEVVYFQNNISVLWGLLLPLFIISQVIRIWALLSLGFYWNTKILVLPKAIPITKGPYQFIRHPNYVVVTIELLVIPLLFEAYFTATIFTICNFLVLYHRIQLEEWALKNIANYDQQLAYHPRFLPKLKKYRLNNIKYK